MFGDLFSMICVECFAQAGLVYVLVDYFPQYLPGADAGQQAAIAALASGFVAKPVANVIMGMAM